MASSAEYLEHLLDPLAGVPEAGARKMMGEYLFCSSGKLFGGVYDDRSLAKCTEESWAALQTSVRPYVGASEKLEARLDAASDRCRARG